MKWMVFLVAAFGTGIAGALIYLQKARISPDAAFSVQDWTAYVIFIVVIGGIGTIEGPIVGVLVFFILQSLLADYGTWYLMILGVIGIIIMLFAPRAFGACFPTKRTGIELFPGAPASDRRLCTEVFQYTAPEQTMTPPRNSETITCATTEFLASPKEE
jgi:branched-chain amino acid transport system permease protein